MCGIAGFAGRWQDADISRRQLAGMITSLAHRGPDGTGMFLGEGVGLAHARLAIIDPHGGHQPMHSQDDAISLVFNGEIFNYVELRDELIAQGLSFRTESDTEVLLQLYRRDGADCVQHLNGQFAFALWDARSQRLLLARDRTGIRPLFLTQNGGRWWFASEAKALLAVLPHAPELAPAALAATFTYWSTPEPDTVYRGIEALPAGCISIIEADGSRTTRRYWDWDFATPQQVREAPWHSPADAARELRSLLEDAVRLQLRADVPVGAYLSGGLDSSGIVALIRHCTSTPLETFSIAFEDAALDETPYQQMVSRHLGTHHHTLGCRARDIGEAFPRFMQHAETPILRTAGVPLMLLADNVRSNGFKVVLTGEGADEVFGGYDIFKEAKVRRFWARQPGSQWRPRLLNRLYPYLDQGAFGGSAMAAAYFGQDLDAAPTATFSHLPRWRTSRRTLAMLAPDLRADLAGWDHAADYARTLPAHAGNWTPMGRDQYIEAKSLLAGYLLAAQGDRAAMAASIEGRYPFLDHRLIEFAGRLPPSWKVRGLDEKHILKRALADLLPADILRRPKQPYRAPDSASFFVDGQPLDYVGTLLSPDAIRQAGYFDPNAVSALFEKCRKGRATGFSDNQSFVGVLSTMLLHHHGMLRSRQQHAHAMPVACA